MSAILIAPGGASGPLRGLIDRLVSAGVTATIVDELAVAVQHCRRSDGAPAILLDLRELGSGEIEDQRRAADAVRRTIAALPNAMPIAVTTAADGRLIIACIRAGAGDVIDLGLDGTATARVAVQRVCQRQRERAFELDMLTKQRQIIEDLLKDLIQTERRTIDAEEALAAVRSTGEISIADSPSVLLIEHDRAVADELADLLEAAGVATYAYATGEEALREASTLYESTGLDLALVAAQLPGIDGLATVRTLREQLPRLDAFLMTAIADGDLAAHAADLGVVGFVQKPFADVTAVVERLVELAHQSQQRTRERIYLRRIKERHERVLARYRSLPREP